MSKDGICNIEIIVDEIQNVLKNIRTDKSSAAVDIRSIVLVDAFYCQVMRVVKMYNGSLTLCTYPDDWKKTTIIPLSKVSDPQTVSDMRPISLLPLPCKILEIIFSRCSKTFLCGNGILSNRQHGFPKKRSTFSAIVECLHDIYDNLNDHKDTYIVYLDLKKAFDTVSCEICINKLKMIGLD